MLQTLPEGENVCLCSVEVCQCEWTQDAKLHSGTASVTWHHPTDLESRIANYSLSERDVFLL